LEFVQIEKISDIIILKINRPEVLNALNYELVAEFLDIFDKISVDNSCRAVILTGEGEKAFCSGGDLKYVIKLNPIQAERYATKVHQLLNKIENLEKPVIAAINGFALGGGCQLALACDIRIASENARIGQTEVKVGIPPGWGGTQRLSRIVGIGFAKEMIFTGKIISAEEAKKIKLVNMIVYEDKISRNNYNGKSNEISLNKKLINESIRFAKSVSKNRDLAIKISKDLINHARDVNIDGGLFMERYGCAVCFTDLEIDNKKKYH